MELYADLLEAPDEKIAGEIFNAAYQNYSVAETARIVKGVVEEELPELKGLPIVTEPTDDIRSYHISSEKIRRILGFEPRKRIEDGVRDLIAAFRAGKLPDSMTDIRYYNIRMMKAINLR